MINSRYLLSDLLAGLLVSLIALPLCLGIAQASGFPPVAGVFTSVIGGMVVTWFSNASLAIKGPTAGLIVIALSAVTELGGGSAWEGYRFTLAIVVLSGIIQIALGLLKLGKYSDLFPSAAIQGLLVSIGLIIIAKQVPVMLGAASASGSPLELLLSIPAMVLQMNPKVAAIGLGGLLLLFALPALTSPAVRKVAPLLVVLLSVPAVLFFKMAEPHQYSFANDVFAIEPASLLVQIPDNLLAAFTLPDFSKMLEFATLKYVFLFTVIGSLESVLSVKAVDNLDVRERRTNANKDLMATGIGNVISGMIGGLPMVTAIVRSSANANNGAQTRMANFFHGLVLLLIVVLLGDLVGYIPIAALAAILVYTGYRLASPQKIKLIKARGKDQFFVFLVTIIAILTTNLLTGMLIGMVTEVIIHLAKGVRPYQLLRFRVTARQKAQVIQVRVGKTALFSNVMSFRKLLDNSASYLHINIDLSETEVMDYTFAQKLKESKKMLEKDGKTVHLTGLEQHKVMEKVTE